MKRSILYIILVLVVIIIVKYYISSYEITYKVDGYNIKTIYKKDRFYIELEKDYVFNMDILKRRGFGKLKIEKIVEIKGEDFFCIYPSIEDLETYPLCIKGEKHIDFHLIESDLLKEYKKENNLNEQTEADFYYYGLPDNIRIALWRYNGFYTMEKKKYEYYKLFEIDKYDNSLCYQYEDKLLLPNYDETYEFKNFILFDIKTGKKENIKSDYEIDYDSYLVGDFKDSVYLYDSKYSVLYEININKKEVTIKGNEEIGFVRLVDGEFESTQRREYKVNKIKYEKTLKSNYNYYINEEGINRVINENSTLSTLIFNQTKVNIIEEINEDLYFTYNNYLYIYSPSNGLNKVLYYYELNFNNENIIYLYNDQ